MQTSTGQKLKFDSKLAHIEALGDTLQRQVSARLLPGHTQALNSGQRLTFGPLSLDHEGLYAGYKSLLWREIKTIRLERGAIAIEAETGGRLNSATVTVEHVLNFWIFHQIVSQLAKVV